MSRPKNLKDILCKSNLPDVPGRSPSDFLTWGTTNTHFTTSKNEEYNLQSVQIQAL